MHKLGSLGAPRRHTAMAAALKSVASIGFAASTS